MAEISASLIKDLVEYDPLRGTFVWKFRPVSMFKSEKFQKIWNTRFANQKAFSVDNKAGYLKGAVLGKEYLAHRVAWAVYHGSWPCGEIDHINGNRSDNRISNLREASRTENARNCTNTGSFGYSGVIYEAKLRKFRARIMADRKVTTLVCMDVQQLLPFAAIKRLLDFMVNLRILTFRRELTYEQCSAIDGLGHPRTDSG